jgi:hypothetical protein
MDARTCEAAKRKLKHGLQPHGGPEKNEILATLRLFISLALTAAAAAAVKRCSLASFCSAWWPATSIGKNCARRNIGPCHVSGILPFAKPRCLPGWRRTETSL